jgi:putative acetyltransferase
LIYSPCAPFVCEHVLPRVRGSGDTLSELALRGCHEPEAIRCYEKAGYHRCGPFGKYAEDPLSIFMNKTLE